MKEGARFSDMDTRQKPTTTSAAQKRKLNDSSSVRKLALASSLIEQSFEKLKNRNANKPPPLPNGVSSSSASSSSSGTTVGSTGGGISYGPLTQRLISALIEQNLMTPFDNEIADYLDRISPPESSYISPRTMAKKCFTFPSTTTTTSTSTSNTSSSSGHIEKKIKRTLIEQGILDLDEERNGSGSAGADDANGQSGTSTHDECELDKDDEIGHEMLAVQRELRMVAQQVKHSLAHLVDLSKQNIAKQEIRKKIAALDNEVCLFVFVLNKV